MLLRLFLQRSPGGENDASASSADSESEKDLKHEGEKKTLGEKIREALQEWSNDDQRDQEIDDRTP